MTRNERGQALLETSLAAAVAALALAGAATLFKAQWDRVRCARQAFEAARAGLVRSAPGLDETPRSVRATRRCGGALESVELPRLEHAGW